MSEFTEDALKLLVETSKSTLHAAAKAAVICLPGVEEYLIVESDGTVGRHKAPDPKRDHKLLSVDDVVSWAKMRSGIAGEGGVTYSPVIVWIGKTSIVATLDDARVRDDRASYTFAKTPEFLLLERLSLQRPEDTYQQGKLLQAIRTTLWNNFDNEAVRSSLVKSLRNVTASQNSQIASGKGTYVAEMIGDHGTEKWPDRFDLNVRVFTDDSLPTTCKIDVVFEVDADRKLFLLWPTVASLTAADDTQRDLAAQMIRSQTEGVEGINVFLGSP